MSEAGNGPASRFLIGDAGEAAEMMPVGTGPMPAVEAQLRKLLDRLSETRKVSGRPAASGGLADEQHCLAPLTRANPLPQKRFGMNRRHALLPAGQNNGSGLVAG
jgi:hypothetical protein